MKNIMNITCISRTVTKSKNYISIPIQFTLYSKFNLIFTDIL